VDVGIFTNLTQDHLDYHGTMERYAAAKARLFAGVGARPPRVAVINLNDAAAGQMIQTARGCEQVWTYGVHQGADEQEAAGGRIARADFEARNVTLGTAETQFELHTPFSVLDVRSRLVGIVNVYNLIGAMTAGIARGLTVDDVVSSAEMAKAAPGRFETIENALGLTVVVDYAHTDDALRNLITLARDLVRRRGGRVITLFGCGGDRDRTKRPRMGRAAGEGSDLVVLTSDNPRSEEPMSIIDEALAGVRETTTECIVESDRAAAIAIAVRAARAGDIVLLAGKGHEKVQIIGDRTVPFDDVAVAASILRELE
jgi:UDP-N-acetylmuramoyl-L-alanyl-D-glutamate--2,6-diaminopimelate ligase